MNPSDKALAALIRAIDPFQRANHMQRSHRYSYPVGWTHAGGASDKRSAA